MNFLKKSAQINKPNLVIVRAGNNSLHRNYFYPAEGVSRSWDRMILSYEDLEPIDSQYAEFIIQGGLTKWTDFASLLNNDFFNEFPYEYILVTDDDMLPIGEGAIDLLFSRAKEFNLKICQPSLTHDSFAYWRITYFSPAFHVRFTNFVEVMCPVFSHGALNNIKSDVSESISGCGLDLIFSELFDLDSKPLGIVDDVQFKHTKAIDSVEGAFYKHLRNNNVDPSVEIKYFLEKYKISQKSVETLGGFSVKQIMGA